MSHRRRLSSLLGSAALAAIMCVSTPLAASAADDSSAPGNNAQWWADTYGVGAAHAAGLTGAGVKVAVIESQINPDLPVFEGTNLSISDKPLCKSDGDAVTTEANSPAIHGTTITAMIIGNGTGAGLVSGIAPDADLTFYGLGPQAGCTKNDTGGLSDFGFNVKNAVDDGARVIVSAVSMVASEADAPVIAYAVARGVAIVAAYPNPNSGVNVAKDYTGMNGVVGVSGIDSQGNLQVQDDGTPFVIPSTTVVASGCCLPTVGWAGDWSASSSRQGSSYAAPTVAGMLALAAQKYPEATGNQLVHALLSSTNGAQHEPVRADDGFGYGAAWLPTLLETDPSSFPDETPLMQGPFGAPTADQIASARANGFEAPETQRQSTFDREAAGANTFDLGSLVPWIIAAVVGLVIVAAAITVIVVIAQRRKVRGRNAS